ncbi:MAG: hypothetical protein GX432_02225 [Candidatus Atribacteria bacterium]|nr:hypothetical protein [Candidatus Atribacteria bacterium]
MLDQEKQMVTIAIHPDERFDPVYHRCHRRVTRIHSYHERIVRVLNCIDAQTALWVRCRTVRCLRCGHTIEELDFRSCWN